MTTLLSSPMIQYGGLGLAFVLTLAFIRGFFMLMTQRQSIQESLMEQHNARERAFGQQFLACIDRNSAALEKVEQGLHRIEIQLAQNDRCQGDAVFLQCAE